MHQDIRIGTLAGKGARTAEYLHAILPHGFESFQLNFHKGFPADMDFKKVARAVRQTLDDFADDAGWQPIVSSIGIFGNPIEDAKIVRDFRTAMTHAHLLGPACNVIAGFTGCVTGKPIPESIKPYARTWAPLVRLAADKNLRIAFENCTMGGSWKNASWNIAVNPAAWELMFDALDASHVGLEWEPCHQITQGILDPLPQLRQWISRIFHVHGKDATVHRDLLATYGTNAGKPWVQQRTPGFGDTNWTDVISILRQHKWTGCIDIEGWHDPVYRGDLEMTGQVHALNYLKRCRGGQFIPNPAGF